jgi:hypothetical protein
MRTQGGFEQGKERAGQKNLSSKSNAGATRSKRGCNAEPKNAEKLRKNHYITALGIVEGNGYERSEKDRS